MEIPKGNEYKNTENNLNLNERVKIAIKEARPLAEVEDEEARSATLINDFIQKRISLQEFTDNSKKIGILKPGEVTFKNLDEMRNFLENLLKDDKLAEELTNHEKEHLDEITKFGWPARLLFRFFKDEEGVLSGRPGVAPNVPEIGNEDEIRNKLKLIIEAVRDLSDTDDLSTRKYLEKK